VILRRALVSGVKKGWGSFLWICRVVIPVSFLVMLLQWSGWLDHAETVLSPLMDWLNLPMEAALPIISGMTVNIYAAIAAMTVLPFSIEQMTLIAVFSLTAHNLIIEGIIQHRSGTHAIKITLVRLTAAVVSVLAVFQFLGDASESGAVASRGAVGVPVLDAIGQWALDTVILLVKILGIVTGVMVVLDLHRARLDRPSVQCLTAPDETPRAAR